MQRYFAKEKIDNKIILEDTDLYHIRVVMRMKDNDEIIAVYDNIPYLCCIENVNEKINILIKKELEQTPDKMPKVRLIVPLLKEQKMDLILQKATEMGVSEIVLYHASRSIIKINDKIDKKIDRWTKIVKEASEQSHRSTIPSIIGVKKIAELEELDGLKLICSTREKEKNIKNIVKSNNNCDRMNIVIGPEGGLDPKEEEQLENLGYIPITLGNRIMRVETVPLFILSVINYEFMEW